jgi:hypothetical protein
MKWKLPVLLFFILSINQLSGYDFWMDGVIGTGYRRDRLNISGSQFASFPDASISKHWNNINTYTLNGKFEYLDSNHLYVLLEGDYGWCNHNSEQFIQAFTTSPDIESKGWGKNSHAYDVKVALGYEFSFKCHKYYFIPLVGFTNNSIKLRNYNYSGLPVGSTSHQRVTWQGAVVGFTGGYRFDSDVEFYCGYEFTPCGYRNVYSENSLLFSGILLTGNQKNNSSYGNSVYAGFLHQFCGDFLVSLKLYYKYFKAGSGPDNTDVLGNGSFQGASWETIGVDLQFGCRF